MSSIKETKNIRAVMIFEIIGKPAEHLTASLNDIVKGIDNEKGVEVKEKKIMEPILMKDQKDFFASHAEVEVEIEEILNLVMLMFKYMPAHIEVISPELITLANNGWSEILSELTRRLHAYDEVARVMQNERFILEKKLQELLPKKEGEKSGK